MEKELADLKDKNRRLVMISRLLIITTQLARSNKENAEANKYMDEIVRESSEVIKACER